MAEALVVALALAAVVAFARGSAGPPHPAALSHRAGQPAATPSVAATTTVPVVVTPSVDTQVSTWWSATGESATAALLADLEALQQVGVGPAGQQGGVDPTTPSESCIALSSDTAAAASAPPPPAPALEREWQLTLSTVSRAAAACQAGRATRLAGDLQPALYTIRDLSEQIKPYLVGQAP